MSAFRRIVSKSLSECIELLDRNARKRGWVQLDLVEHAYNAMMNENNFNQEYALMLIRCCGSLLIKEIMDTRQTFAEKMFSDLRNCLPGGFQLVHLNSLLRVGLQNKRPHWTQIGPQTILDTVNEQNIKTNDLFWRLMLEWYCLDGDNKNALQALSKMKSRPVNKVYNLLAYCYITNNNLNEAKAILEEQEQSIELDNLGMVMRVLLQAEKDSDDEGASRLLDSYSVNYDHISPLADKTYLPLSFLLQHSVLKNYNNLLNRGISFISNHSWPILPLSLSILEICQQLTASQHSKEADKLILAFPSNLDIINWRFLIDTYIHHVIVYNTDYKSLCLHMSNRDHLTQGFYCFHSVLREAMLGFSRTQIPCNPNNYLYWFVEQNQYKLKQHYLYPFLRSYNTHLDELVSFALEYFGKNLTDDINFLRLTVLAMMKQGRPYNEIQNTLYQFNCLCDINNILSEQSDF
ncbi:hypothetical protein GJ496_000963 [Pomphorhynchus laevis]|nr:hypothetical protein GJ496_000963 [Pomphorhynchus laevis]